MATDGRNTKIRAELPQGPNPFWMTVPVVLNVIIFASLGYLLWEPLELWEAE